ncbi:MAG: tripartite tricarboxylate transporter TctB family protein [Pseudomonadota bacterium]
MSALPPIRPGRRFRSETPPDRKFKVDDLLAFKRGRGDLAFSVFMLALALFFLAAFFAFSGWENRDLPDDFGTYLLRQLGLVNGEGRLTRFGRILRQGWVAPAICLLILVPAALLNLRKSWITHRWRQRFKQPVAMEYEAMQWVRALEFVAWFIAYTLIVPILGYLVSTLLLGTLLPFRMGYRGWRWFLICFSVSLAIVLVFRTGLQIKTPVNIWLYSLLPPGPRGFMATWF